MNKDQSMVKLDRETKEYYERTKIDQVYQLSTKTAECNIGFISQMHHNGVIKKIFIQP